MSTFESIINEKSDVISQISIDTESHECKQEMVARGHSLLPFVDELKEVLNGEKKIEEVGRCFVE